MPLVVEKAAAEPKAGPRPRVLVVDDSPAVCYVVGKALSSLECDVVAVATVHEARRMLPGTFSCVLADLELSDGSGVDVARAFSELENAVPFAFLTGGADPDLLAAARQIGPVFAKGDGMDGPVEWVARATQIRSSGTTPRPNV